MGKLLSKTKGKTAELDAGDEVLLLHGLMLMAGADGVIEQAEWDTLRQYWNSLPEFKGQNWDEKITQANKVVSRFGDLKESIKALGEIKKETIRQKLFVLAADLALSSGDVDKSEDELLDTMQRLLKIEDELANKTLEVLTIKYSA